MLWGHRIALSGLGFNAFAIAWRVADCRRQNRAEIWRRTDSDRRRSGRGNGMLVACVAGLSNRYPSSASDGRVGMSNYGPGAVFASGFANPWWIERCDVFGLWRLGYLGF